MVRSDQSLLANHIALIAMPFGFFVVNIHALYIEDALTVVYMLVYKSLLFA